MAFEKSMVDFWTWHSTKWINRTEKIVTDHHILFKVCLCFATIFLEWFVLFQLNFVADSLIFLNLNDLMNCLMNFNTRILPMSARSPSCWLTLPSQVLMVFKWSFVMAFHTWASGQDLHLIIIKHQLIYLSVEKHKEHTRLTKCPIIIYPHF